MKPAKLIITPLFGLVVALGGGGPAQAFGGTIGSGKVVSESREVSGFEAVSVAGSLRLEVRQGAREGLVITGDDNILPLIETVVETTPRGATLVIRTRRGESYRARNAVSVVVDAIRLTGLAASGSGDVLVPSLTTPKLELSLAGSGDAKLKQLSAEALNLRLAGSGDVQAEGSVKALRVSIAGSGNAELAGLAADDVTVSIAGSGDASVRAARSLSASIAGSGDVAYHGNPATLKTSVAGSGRISKR